MTSMPIQFYPPQTVSWIRSEERRRTRLQEKARSACCQIAPFSSTSKCHIQTTRPCCNSKYIYAFHFVPSDCPTEGFDYNQTIAFDKSGKGQYGDCPDKFPRATRGRRGSLPKLQIALVWKVNKQTLQP